MPLFLRKSRGLAALEAVLAAAISLLLFSIAVLKVPRTTPKFEAGRLAQFLETASACARYRRDTVEVVFLSGSAEARTSNRILASHPLPSHLDLRTSGSLSFFASGAATPATLILRCGREACAIKLSLFGRPRIAC